ncbi:hypothetical protein NT6N_29640 [Oceaniferula spumae]|uniref:Uncharacterized protein n=1 Tax=Oceaniferula spumae TaxID=2979115 RepID=A0AAT9FPV6_9BACT
MRRPKIRRKKYFIISVLFVSLLAGVLVFKDRKTSHCVQCRSMQNALQWRLGFWHTASIPLSPRNTEVRRSHLYDDFFQSDHQHEWQFSQGSPYYTMGLSVWGGCAIGSGRHSHPFCQTYELDPSFREFIRSELASGRLDLKTIHQICRLTEWRDEKQPLSPKEAQLRELADELVYDRDW